MHADKPASNQRFTVKEAARRLNVSEAAIRQRIQRESIPYEKDEDTNRVYIILDDDEDRLYGVDTEVNHSSDRELIDTLQEQLRLEREASAELRRIIAGLTQRIPAIEASSDEQGSDLTGTEEPGGARSRPVSQEPEQRRSWLYRFFFGPDKGRT